MMFLLMKFTTVSFFTSQNIATSTYLEKKSITIRIYECPSEDFEVNGPTTSNPQALNGYEATVGCKGSKD